MIYALHLCHFLQLKRLCVDACVEISAPESVCCCSAASIIQRRRCVQLLLELTTRSANNKELLFGCQEGCKQLFGQVLASCGDYSTQVIASAAMTSSHCTDLAEQTFLTLNRFCCHLRAWRCLERQSQNLILISILVPTLPFAHCQEIAFPVGLLLVSDSPSCKLL